jgi:hypothetical protein
MLEDVTYHSAQPYLSELKGNITVELCISFYNIGHNNYKSCMAIHFCK